MCKLTVIIIDDQGTGRLLLKAALNTVTSQADLHLFGDAETASAWLDTNTADILLIDHKLPGNSGLQLINALGRRHNAMQVMLVTAIGDDEIRRAALKTGVDHYVYKGDGQSELVATVRVAVRRQQQIRRRESDWCDLLLGMFNEPSTVRQIGNYVYSLAKLMGRSERDAVSLAYLVRLFSTNENILAQKQLSTVFPQYDLRSPKSFANQIAAAARCLQRSRTYADAKQQMARAGLSDEIVRAALTLSESVQRSQC